MKDGKRYLGVTLHGILCGIQRHVQKQKPRETIDFFNDPEFKFLRDVLDAQMKDLCSHGVGSSKKQAEPISEEEENRLWELGLLGDLNAQTLLDTMVWMCDLYFALRSGVEHRNLRPDQIKLFEPPSSPAYLLYTEDASKNNPGGLKHRNVSLDCLKNTSVHVQL